MLSNKVCGKIGMNIIRLSANGSCNLAFNRLYSKSTKKKDPHVAKKGEKWQNESKHVYKTEEVKDKDFLTRKALDAVWQIKEYPTQLYSFDKCIQFHTEVAQSSILNNTNGLVSVKLLLDMKTNKKAKFMESVKNVVKYPHGFSDGIQREVIAICKSEEQKEAALKAGALYAGYTDVLKLFEKGEISEASYDILVCTPETLPDVTILKKKLKDRLPSVKTKTVGENIEELVENYRMSKPFESSKISEDTAILKLNIGTIDMGLDKLRDNFQTLVEVVKEQTKVDKENFIKSCLILCAPSKEIFYVDLKKLSEKQQQPTESVAVPPQATEAVAAAVAN